VAGPRVVEETVVGIIIIPLPRATDQSVAEPRVVEEMVAGTLPILRATAHNMAGQRVVREEMVAGMLPLPSHIFNHIAM